MYRLTFLGTALALSVLLSVQNAWALGPGGGDITGTTPLVFLTGSNSARVLPGANVSYLDAYDQSSVDVLGGEVSYLTLHNQARGKVNGGIISYLQVYDSSRAEVRKVDDLSWLFLRGAGEAHVYGRNLFYSSGHLFGQWENGSAFQFWALRDDNPGTPPPIGPMPTGLFLHSIPEPATAWLALGVACVAFGRRRSKA